MVSYKSSDPAIPVIKTGRGTPLTAGEAGRAPGGLSEGGPSVWFSRVAVSYK